MSNGDFRPHLHRAVRVRCIFADRVSTSLRRKASRAGLSTTDTTRKVGAPSSFPALAAERSTVRSRSSFCHGATPSLTMLHLCSGPRRCPGPFFCSTLPAHHDYFVIHGQRMRRGHIYHIAEYNSSKEKQKSECNRAPILTTPLDWLRHAVAHQGSSASARVFAQITS